MCWRKPQEDILNAVRLREVSRRIIDGLLSLIQHSVKFFHFVAEPFPKILSHEMNLKELRVGSVHEGDTQRSLLICRDG